MNPDPPNVPFYHFLGNGYHFLGTGNSCVPNDCGNGCVAGKVGPVPDAGPSVGLCMGSGSPLPLACPPITLIPGTPVDQL